VLKKIYWNIRLFSKYRKEPFVSFKKILGFYPHDIKYYEQALLHKSVSIRVKNGKWINNERLEFLGDAILDAIVADILFKQFEYKKEGFLTNIRSKIVQRETLNQLALDLGLDKLIKTSAKNIPHKTHMYGNALEALIGAIYLDRGYRVAKQFVNDQLISKHLNIESKVTQELNFKSQLIEWSQKFKIPIVFKLDKTYQSDDKLTVFVYSVLVYDTVIGTGTGFSKKESQQKAAEQAIAKLTEDKSFQEQIFSIKNELEQEERKEEELTVSD